MIFFWSLVSAFFLALSSSAISWFLTANSSAFSTLDTFIALPNLSSSTILRSCSFCSVSVGVRPSAFSLADFAVRPTTPAAGSAVISRSTSLTLISSPAAKEPNASPAPPKTPSPKYSATSALALDAPAFITDLEIPPPIPAESASKEPTIPALIADSLIKGCIKSLLLYALSRASASVTSTPASCILPIRVVPNVNAPEP